MEFNSKEEMLAFECERERYYMESIDAIHENLFKFYFLWLRELIVPRYRKLKKIYDNYSGGYYKDEYGLIHAKHVAFVDNKHPHGTICIVEDDLVPEYKEMYVMIDSGTDSYWTKMDKEFITSVEERLKTLEEQEE